MSKDAKGHGSDEREHLQKFASKTEKELGLSKFHLSKMKHGVNLDLIAVGKDGQGKGTGSEALRRLTSYADEHGHKLTLTPAKMEDYGTTSTKRLTDFYKRHGFVENKGRNKDYSISAGMLREPVAAADRSEGPKPDDAPEPSKAINPRGDTVKPKDKK